jgi:TP901 family phage tail tape measure protein
MPSARDIKAGAAYVELTLRDGALSRGLRRAQRRLQVFSGMVGDLGRRLTRLSALMSAPFIAGVGVYAAFEQQLANVATMLERPEEHLPRFRDEIRQMAAEFGESTEALAGGLYDILSASVPAEEALSVLAVAARAAKAGLTDTATAADAITTVLNAYGLSADRAGDVSDLLFGVVRRGKTTFGRLAPTIGNIATLASSAGLGLEELGAGIALLTRNGIKTEEAITALSAIISTFLKPSAEGAELAEQLGFQLDVATLRAEGLEGVFRRLGDLPPDALAQLFPNVRALKGVLPALANLEGFAEDVDAMRNRAGATEEAYSTMTGTLMTGFKRLRESALGVLSVLGEAIAEPVAKASATIMRFLTMLREWIEQNQELVRTFVTVITVVGAVGTTLIAVGVAGQIMAFVFGGIAAILGGLATAIGLVGSALAALLTPIGIIITAFVGLGAYLLHSTGAGAAALDWLGERFNALKATALAAWQGIGDALAAGDLGLAMKVLWLTLKMEWRRGINFLNRGWIQFKEFFLSIASTAFYGVAALLVDAWAGLQVAWLETVDFLVDAWAVFTTFLARTWNSTQGWLEKRILELWGLFDSELDVEGAKQEVDLETTFENDRLQRDLYRDLNQRGDRRQERRAEIERERSGSLEEIGRMANADEDARRARYAADMAASEEALNTARQEWTDALEQARSQRAASEGQNDDPAAPRVGAQPEIDAPALIDELRKQLTDVATNVGDAAERTTDLDTTGTFNALAARGLGLGSSALDRTARATEDTARNTQRLARLAQDGGLTFE